MNYRIFLLLIIFLSFASNSNAQYYWYLTNDNFYHSVHDALELNDKSLVIPDVHWDEQLMILTTVVYKFDSYGHIFDSLVLQNANDYYQINFVEHFGDDLLFAGTAFDKSDFSTDFVLIITDTSLNILQDTIFGGEDDELLEAIHVSGDSEIYLNTTRKLDTGLHFILYQLNSNLHIVDSIKKEFNGQIHSDIAESNQNDKLFVSLPQGGEYWVIDRDELSIDTAMYYTLPNMGLPAGCLASLTDSSILEVVYKRKWQGPDPFLNQLCLLFRNVDGEMEDYFVIDPSSDSGEMIRRGCIHVNNKDSIVLLATRGAKIWGHANYDFDQDSWFTLYNISSDGIMNWNKSYGGDGFYRSEKMLHSKDGGYYLIGTFHDWRLPNPYDQLVIYKVDKNGDMVTSIEPHEIENSQVKVYPNPVSNILTIEIDNGIRIEQIRVIDIQGRIQSESVFDQFSNTVQINLGLLDPGLYIIQLVDSKNFVINKRIIVSH